MNLSKFRVPHVYVLLFCIMIVVVILSHVIPAGEFMRVEDPDTGRMIIEPDSFHFVEPDPLGFFDLFLAIPNGMARAVDVLFMVVLTLAGMEIIIQTGALQRGITKAMRSMQGKETMLLIITALIFGCIGAFVGWAEGILMFIPLSVALTRLMGYDALVGLGITSTAAAAGFATAPTNIYTVGVAQGIVDLPLFSGLEFRLVTFAVIMIPTIWYVVRYAKRIKADPGKSLVSDIELQATLDLEASKNEEKVSFRDGLVIFTLIFGFVLAVYGTLNWGWFMREIAANFTMIGIIGGVIGGLSIDQIPKAYAKGAEKIIWSGLTIGIAAGILVLLEDGLIIDSIIYYLSQAVMALPAGLTAIGIFLVQVIINTFIPSASGQALTTVPILAPVAELAGSTQQVAILAYQYGDGFTNQLVPTIAVLWAALSLAGGVPYQRWVKFVGPLVLSWLVLGIIFITIAHFMQLGPF